MHMLGFPEMVIIMSVLLVLFFAKRKPRGPRKPPQHPLPSHEPLLLYLRIKRPRADTPHF